MDVTLTIWCSRHVLRYQTFERIGTILVPNLRKTYLTSRPMVIRPARLAAETTLLEDKITANHSSR